MPGSRGPGVEHRERQPEEALAEREDLVAETEHQPREVANEARGPGRERAQVLQVVSPWLPLDAWAVFSHRTGPVALS